MNERIFELAKQVDLIQWDTLPSGARTPDHESVVKAKKFSELIIRECLGIVNRKEYSYHEADPLWETSQLIKEHFGVKE